MSASNNQTPMGLAANLLIVAQQRNEARAALARVEALAEEYEQQQTRGSETFADEYIATEIRAAIRGDEQGVT